MPRAARVPLLGAAVCAALLVATGCLTFLSASFRARDAASLDGFMALERSRLGPQTGMWAHLVDPPVYGLAALVLIGLGLHFHGRRNAVVIAMVLIGSGVTTKILKTVLDVPRPSDLLFKQVAAVSWPSGHATAALSLAICLVLAVPPARRPLAALVGAPFAIVVSYSTLVQGWHFPSDTIGGFLVAAIWGFLALALLAGHRVPATDGEPARRLLRRTDLLTLAGGLAGAAAALIAVAAITHRDDPGPFVQGHGSFLFVAGLIAVLATAVAAGLAHVSRD